MTWKLHRSTGERTKAILYLFIMKKSIHCFKQFGVHRGRQVGRKRGGREGERKVGREKRGKEEGSKREGGMEGGNSLKLASWLSRIHSRDFKRSEECDFSVVLNDFQN